MAESAARFAACKPGEMLRRPHASTTRTRCPGGKASIDCGVRPAKEGCLDRMGSDFQSNRKHVPGLMSPSGNKPAGHVRGLPAQQVLQVALGPSVGLDVLPINSWSQSTSTIGELLLSQVVKYMASLRNMPDIMNTHCTGQVINSAA